MIRTSMWHQLVLGAVVASAVACGGSSKAGSPAAPSATTASGAVINGSLSSSSGSTAPAGMHVAGGAAGSGATVSVPGTSLATIIDSGGRFTLTGVPSGDVTLQFSGGGLGGQVALSSVRSDDSITLSLSVSGSIVTVDADRRRSGSGDELEGRVESLPPTTPPGTFVVGGQQVSTDAGTKFYLGDATVGFSSLAIGQRVHVSGRPSGTMLLASVVQIQNTNTVVPVQVNGIVENFGGNAGAFQFTISGQLVKGDGSTAFDSSAFTDLKNGVRVEVTAQQRDGFVLATRIHVNVSDAGGGQDDSASIEGLLTAKSGGIPNLTLVVGGTTVTTSASTEVRRKGDVQDLSVLQLNMTLHVEGTRLGNGSIAARMIQIKDDATGGVFQISGSMGGLKGACPSMTFGVNGYSIFTDGSTAFTPACSSFKSGDKVTVVGITQADGRVKATAVSK